MHFLENSKLQSTFLGSLDCEGILKNIVGCNNHFLVFLNHFMLEIPTSTLAYFRDDRIAVSKKVNVEVDVMDGLVFMSAKCL
jgi:hypothetical protein